MSMNTRPRQSSRIASRQYTVPSTGRVYQRVWANVVNGNIPLEELDDDELREARLKDSNGHFGGPPGKLIPRELSDQRTREVMTRVASQFRDIALNATKAFIDTLDDDLASHADKMKAAEYLHQRFLGKVPDKMELTAEVKPWESLVSGTILRDLPTDDDD